MFKLCSHILLCVLAAQIFLSESSACQIDPKRSENYRKIYQVPGISAKAKIAPNWVNGNSFWYSQPRTDGGGFEFIWIKNGQQQKWFDPQKLKTQLESQQETKISGDGLPFSHCRVTNNGAIIQFQWKNQSWIYDIPNDSLSKVKTDSKAKHRQAKSLRAGFTSGAQPVLESSAPNGKWFLGDDKTNLYLRKSGSIDHELITDSGIKDYVWTAGNAKWSPDNKYIAVTRIDSRKCDRIPVIDWTSKAVEKVHEHPYSKAGRPQAISEIYFIDVETRQHQKIEQTGLEDHYYHAVGWINGELWFHKMDRRYQRLELLAASPNSGKTRTVLIEESDTFIGALYYHVDKENYLFSDVDEQHFLWIAERDGWRHLYLHEKQSGKLIRQLTQGDWEVERVLAVNKNEKWVSFLAHAEKDPYETHVYRIGLDGSGFKRLTEGKGQHTANWSKDVSQFVDVWSSSTEPVRSEVRDSMGNLINSLVIADVNQIRKSAWVQPETFVCKAADGKTDLHGVIFKPYDFDPARKYPVLDHIYNGPFTKWVPRTFDDPRAIRCQAIAHLGFVVMVVDGRGTIGRGKKFQDVVYRNWGQHEIPDHAAVLKQLAAERSWMDTGRVGIFGGSWGGYMTLRALLTHPDVYHAGVATAAVADLNDHASVPIEGYMGLPKENPRGYRKASNLRIAANLKGKLLIIHGTADVNATFSASMKMTKALIDAGKHHDLVILPNAPHWAQGKNAVYMQQKLANHFQTHLKPNLVIKANRDKKPVTTENE